MLQHHGTFCWLCQRTENAPLQNGALRFACCKFLGAVTVRMGMIAAGLLIAWFADVK